MRCPFCAHESSQVKDSRPAADGSAIRRRRQCEECGARFTTFERIQLRDITVIKTAAPGEEPSREPFDRDKLERAVALACRKRGIGAERIERLVTAIQRRIETSGDEIASAAIGEMVMDGLRQLDPVAYIRFASVYREFSEASDFADAASEISDREA